jgi:hypothetical protein
VERDLAELAEARARALGAGGGSGGDGEGSAGGGGLAAAAAADAFVEAQLAKRQRALGRAHVDDPMEVGIWGCVVSVRGFGVDLHACSSGC